MIDPAKHADSVVRQRKLNRQQTYSGLVFLAVAVAILFILPDYLSSPYDGMAMGFGAAALFSVFFYENPEALRSRTGSLVPGICLGAALWLLAALTAIVQLIG